MVCSGEFGLGAVGDLRMRRWGLRYQEIVVWGRCVEGECDSGKGLLARWKYGQGVNGGRFCVVGIYNGLTAAVFAL